MSEKQKVMCDRFIYIPQYGSGTASLNVNVATGLILYQYSSWYKSIAEQGISDLVSKVDESDPSNSAVQSAS
jgi:hypothetical protein